MTREDDSLSTADLAATNARAEEPTDAHEVGADAERRELGEDAERNEDGHSRADVVPGEERAAADEPERTPLLPEQQAAEFRARWEELQTGFVDEPRRSVEEGDALVAELMQQLATSFSEERRTLESQWDRGDDVSTEDLRVALQRYRSFFVRLLSA